ncbi:RBBP9/YdeN family alpha/beta hydrolase [Rhizobium sp. BR 314]|uniref:RBBP9/YdeN family alpha/beta hydrolase n=1 Tax=Rhizobium sp. BR 314 TaxID=3040013 RepID=UPI0039BED12C
MVATLILPGLNGSAEGHWQRHWARDNASSTIVRQASWSRPALHEWLQSLEGELERVGDAWLVAHSLGCLLAAHIATRPAARHVRGAFLVAPCDLERTERLHPGVIDFGEMPTDRLPFRTFVVGSRGDRYMDFVRLRRYAALWGVKLHDLGHAGHINIESGFGQWRQGYQLFSSLTDAPGRRAPKGTQPQRVSRAITASA